MKLGNLDIVDCKIGSTQINKVYLGSNLVWQKASPLLLDLYPDAAAAYSLRKLRTAYAGSAIRVRRSSDNTELNIGFVDNELDTVALLSFVGAGYGFVTVWYDQSGEGNDVSQVLAGNQPQIVSSGVVIERDGAPSVKFDGINDSISNFTSGFINTIDVSYFSISNNDVSESIGTISSQSFINQSTVRIFNDRRNTIKRNLVVTTNISTYYSDLQNFSNSSSQRLLSGFIDSSNNMIAYKDGVAGTTDTYVGTVENNGLNLGSQAGITFLNGTIKEFIAYNSDQSSNRTGIESNINSHYNIY